MAKAAAPTSLTGGQGFNFEDHVAARPRIKRGIPATWPG